MGQIVIDIPNSKSRRYVISEERQAEELINLLDESAVGVEDDSDVLGAREDAEDLEDIRAALEEFRQSGKKYRWEDVKAELRP